MAIGFIHGKLDVKLLILYLLDRAAGPVSFPTLTDLALCDPGVDYFLFAESAGELVASGHAALEEGRYAITEKGRRNIADCESSLSPVIRNRCDHRLIPVNAELRRSAQVRASVTEGEDGTPLLSLALDDHVGNLMALSLALGSREQGERMAQRFQSAPEEVYRGILKALLPEEDGAESP